MRASDVIRKLRENLERLKQERKEQTLRITNDLAALVKLRIQTSGRSFQGSPFAPYTPEYARERGKDFQTGFVDFTRSGDLMRNIQARVVQNEEGKTVVAISTDNDKDNDKVRGALKKRGNILRPSADEIAMAADANRERIAKIFEI